MPHTKSQASSQESANKSDLPLSQTPWLEFSLASASFSPDGLFGRGA